MPKKKEEITEENRHRFVQALRVEFHFRDFLQVIIGASILSVPVGFTEESWHLGETLPVLNVIILMTLSIFFISVFIYHHYYENSLKDHWTRFVERVSFTYIVSFLVVALILTVIQRAPWSVDLILSLKRVAIVTFPASLSAAVVDVLK